MKHYNLILNNSINYKEIESFFGVSDVEDKMAATKPWPYFTSTNTTILPFIHIPKTGGSSFWLKLKQKIGSSSPKIKNILYPPKNFKSFNSPGCKKGKSFGNTHCGFVELENCFNQGWAEIKNHYMSRKYISIIRHPVQRVISEYYWWKSRNCNPAWSESLCQDRENFKNWILNEENTAHNRQVKSFYGDINDLDQPDHKIYATTNVQNTVSCLNINSTATFLRFGRNVTDLNQNFQILKSVIENLERNFIFVGLSSHITISVDLLKNILTGQETPHSLPRKRTKRAFHRSKNRPEFFDLELLKLIAERNQLDMKLYGYVLTKFRNTLENSF